MSSIAGDAFERRVCPAYGCPLSVRLLAQNWGKLTFAEPNRLSAYANIADVRGIGSAPQNLPFVHDTGASERVTDDGTQVSSPRASEIDGF